MLTVTIEWPAIARFLLVFCRVAGALMAAPLLGSERLPARVKAALALVIAAALAPTAKEPGLASGPALALAAGAELLLGVSIGFGARLIFAAVQMGGEMADAQAAFGFAGVVAPDAGEHVSVIGQLHMAIAWLIFLAVNGHHAVLRGLADSFSAIPLGMGPGAVAPPLTAAVASLLAAALRLAAPIIAAALLADLSLGLLTRAAPQMNLLAIGFPIKLGAGLVATLVALPLLAGGVRSLVGVMETIIRALIGASS